MGQIHSAFVLNGKPQENDIQKHNNCINTASSQTFGPWLMFTFIVWDHWTRYQDERWQYCHGYGVNYKRDLDWWPDLLDSDTARNYTLTVQSLFLTHTHTHTCPQSRLHCRCLVAAFNCRRSPSSGFPNYHRASATSFSQQQLTTKPLQFSNLLKTLLITVSRHGPHRKYRSSVAVYEPLPSNDRCLVVGFAVVA
jgi:hypothetical protein